VILSSSKFEDNNICGEAVLTFDTIFSFLDHGNILRSDPVSMQASAVKKREKELDLSPDDYSHTDEKTRDISDPFTELEDLTLIRQDSSINKKKHTLTLVFKQGKFHCIQKIDTTNVAP
jgi:hypothetical protein